MSWNRSIQARHNRSVMDKDMERRSVKVLQYHIAQGIKPSMSAVALMGAIHPGEEAS
jgi:hypothetical protein